MPDPVDTTTASPISSPTWYIDPSTGFVASKLLLEASTKYPSALGEEPVKLPSMVVVVALLNWRVVGWAVGVVQSGRFKAIIKLF